MSVAPEREGLGRLQRSLDEAYTRYAGEDEESRVEGLVEALGRALALEPEEARAALLEELGAGYVAPPEAHAHVAHAAATSEIDALREEIERLRAAPPPPRAGATENAVVEALLGGGLDPREVADPTRVAGAVRALAIFAMDLIKGFLSTSDPGSSLVQLDRFRAALRGELQGASPAGTTAALLEETKLAIGLQAQAFTIACVRGAKGMLSELDPVFLEDLSAGGGFLGIGKHQKMWETFEKHHRELLSSDDLYDTYFDGAFRAALLDLRARK